MTIRGYILISKGGLSEAVQRDALAAIGVDLAPSSRTLFKDDMRYRMVGGRGARADLVERARALSYLAPGDVLAIASPACLGLSEPDLRVTLEKIIASHAELKVGSPSMRVRADDASGVLQFLTAAVAERKAAYAAFMREARVTKASKGGRRPRRLDEAAALRMWRDPACPAAVVARTFGVSERTLHRRLGARVVLPSK